MPDHETWVLANQRKESPAQQQQQAVPGPVQSLGISERIEKHRQKKRVSPQRLKRTISRRHSLSAMAETPGPSPEATSGTNGAGNIASETTVDLERAVQSLSVSMAGCNVSRQDI